MKAKSKYPKSVRSNTGVLEQLEARILFSADMFSTLLDSNDKSESAASDTEELDSLLVNPTAITGVLDKNRLDEQKENIHSSKSVSVPSVSTSVIDPFAGVEASHATDQHHSATALTTGELTGSVDSAKDQIAATHSESPRPNTFDAIEDDAVDDKVEIASDKPERTGLIFIDGSVEDLSLIHI